MYVEGNRENNWRRQFCLKFIFFFDQKIDYDLPTYIYMTGFTAVGTILDAVYVGSKYIYTTYSPNDT